MSASTSLKSWRNALMDANPLLATVYGDTITEQIEFSKQAIQSGTSALMLQPPSQKMDDAKLVDFFSEIISAVDCPVGIQNAPEFLGFGLSNESLIALANDHENFTIAKLEVQRRQSSVCCVRPRG